MPRKSKPDEVPQMAPKEFNRLLKRLGLSQTKAARRLGTSRRSVVAYSTGETIIPGPVAVALRCLSQAEG
jgi:DNA-binding transcriptional regulator YiaG